MIGITGRLTCKRSLTVRCRLIAGRLAVLGLRHCFIQFEDENKNLTVFEAYAEFPDLDDARKRKQYMTHWEGPDTHTREWGPKVPLAESRPATSCVVADSLGLIPLLWINGRIVQTIPQRALSDLWGPHPNDNRLVAE